MEKYQRLRDKIMLLLLKPNQKIKRRSTYHTITLENNEWESNKNAIKKEVEKILEKGDLHYCKILKEDIFIRHHNNTL